MKKMLIAATAVGAAIAGIVLIARKRGNRDERLWSDAAKDAYKTMNNGLGKLERNPWHSLG